MAQRGWEGEGGGWMGTRLVTWCNAHAALPLPLPRSKRAAAAAAGPR